MKRTSPERRLIRTLLSGVGLVAIILISPLNTSYCLADSDRPLSADFYPEQGCPVSVVNIRSILEVDPFGAPSACKIYLSYSNISQKPITAVKFRCRYLDPNGKDRGTFHGTDVAHVSAGSTHNQKWKREGGLHPNISNFAIRVLQVKYEDGNIWTSSRMAELAQPGNTPVWNEGQAPPQSTMQPPQLPPQQRSQETFDQPFYEEPSQRPMPAMTPPGQSYQQQAPAQAFQQPPQAPPNQAFGQPQQPFGGQQAGQQQPFGQPAQSSSGQQPAQQPRFGQGGGQPSGQPPQAAQGAGESPFGGSPAQAPNAPAQNPFGGGQPQKTQAAQQPPQSEAPFPDAEPGAPPAAAQAPPEEQPKPLEKHSAFFDQLMKMPPAKAVVEQPVQKTVEAPAQKPAQKPAASASRPAPAKSPPSRSTDESTPFTVDKATPSKTPPLQKETPKAETAKGTPQKTPAKPAENAVSDEQRRKDMALPW